MADIALRDYNQEIDTIINNGRLNEAIAHCLYILKIYPKHITSYRQLGNAFLEAKRYSDALDIFQRLLATVPDDFIANLGMSIIREDEGNLDAAIWFMERAFEQKPSNKAIQDELRKLYGKRDRVELPKIRLTRGALARMYARGDQIPQAIAEIEAALKEDPKRPDLQVLLADMYYQVGNDIEALETCKALLNKLPDCFEANRLQAILLEKAGKAEEARPYRERINALDPYEAKVSSQIPTTDQVPSDAIILPKLDIPIEQLTAASSQPAWAASLGIAASSILSGQEETPEWMKTSEESQFNEPATETPSSLELPTSKEKSVEAEEELPDWMKEAGWNPSESNPKEDSILTEELEYPSDEEGELPQADLPDWLQSIGTEDGKDVTPSEGANEEDQTLVTLLSKSEQPDVDVKSEENLPVESIPDWLNSLSDEDSPEVNPPTPKVESESTESTPTPLDVPPATPVDFPVWLNDNQPGPSDTIGSWLSGNQPTPKEPVPEPAKLPPISDDSDELPEWLRDFAGEETSKVKNQAVEPAVQPIVPQPEPEFIISPTTPGVEGVNATGGPDQTSESIPEWVKSFAEKPPLGAVQAIQDKGSPESTPTTEEEAQLATKEELPEWLRSYAQEETLSSGTPSKSIPTETEAALQTGAGEEELPDWLADLITETNPIETPITESSVEPLSSESVEEAQSEPGAIPDWLSKLEEETQAETPTAELSYETTSIEDHLESEEVPDWLSSFNDEEIPAETIPAEAHPESEAFPDWLSKLEEEPLAETPAEAAASEVPSDAIPNEAQTEPEAFPDWLNKLEEEAQAETPAEAAAVEIPSEAIPVEELPESEILPDWLSRLGEETPTETSTEIPTAKVPSEAIFKTELPSEAISAETLAEAGTIPEWLSSLDEEGTVESANVSDVELPDWLRSINEAEPPSVEPNSEAVPADTTILPADIEGVPSVLAETTLPEGQQVSEFESPPDFEDMDAAIAWLENMSASHLSQQIPTSVEPSIIEPMPLPEIAIPSGEITPISEAELLGALNQENVEPTPSASSLESIESKALKSDWIPESELEDLTEEAARIIPSAQEAIPPVQVPSTDEFTWLPPAANEDQEISTTEISSISGDLPKYEEPNIHPVNINSASLVELERLPGVGFRLAQNIINYRQTQGPFEKVDDLVNILNVSPDAFLQMKDYLTVEQLAVATETQPSLVSIQATPTTQVTVVLQEMLDHAQAARIRGQFSAALEQYEQLIKSRVLLDQVIQDLIQMVKEQPGDYLIHQALGDAYLRSDRLQEAMDAYTRAENLLK